MNGYEAKQYRRQRGCIGGVHVIPVPRGMTPEEAWAEMTIIGRLLEPDEYCTWATYECEGGPNCSCLEIDPADNYEHWHNDVKVWPR